jgi:hypothetical protein
MWQRHVPLNGAGDGASVAALACPQKGVQS